MKTTLLALLFVGLVSMGHSQSSAVQATIAKNVKAYFGMGMYASGPIAVRSVNLKMAKTVPVQGSANRYASSGTAILTVIDRANKASNAPSHTIVHSFEAVSEVYANGKGKLVDIKTH